MARIAAEPHKCEFLVEGRNAWRTCETRTGPSLHCKRDVLQPKDKDAMHDAPSMPLDLSCVAPMLLDLCVNTTQPV